MYGKIFDSIYDGTLAEDWRALITFQQFIVLCNADGMVDMTPQSISRRTGIPIEHIKAGIEILEKADKYSRTPDENGKRIELIDEHRPWGWHIVNHEKYKRMQDVDTVRAQTRERVKKHRELKRTVTHGNGQKRYIDIDINTLKDMPKSEDLSFHEFWDKYPRKLNRKKSETIWKRISKSNRLKILTDIESRFTNVDSQFIPYPSSYLNQERWNDEPENNSQDEQTKFAI